MLSPCVDCLLHCRPNVVTLYLILFVELVRHIFDHAARGRPFFTAVLSMVYSERKLRNSSYIVIFFVAVRIF